jgi:Putative prokaryotic signal transducing protein
MPRVVAATGRKGERHVRELVRTNDIVLVSAVGALLGILPRRILVHEDDNREARQLLAEAGLAHELRPDD